MNTGDPYGRTIRVKVVLLLLQISSIIALGGALDEWSWRNPVPTGNPVAGMNFVNGSFVALGEGGSVASSTNGDFWTTARIPTTNSMKRLSYGGGRYVAAGARGTVAVSLDLKAWSVVQFPSANDISDISFGAGVFVVVGRQGMIANSRDGINWVFSNGGPEIDLTGVVFGQGQFMASGLNDTILTSTDGVQWMPALAPTAANRKFVGIAYGNDRFVAAGFKVTSSPFGDFARANHVTSVNGVDWVNVLPADTTIPSSITYGGGKFLVTCGDMPSVSEDGLMWTNRTRLNGGVPLFAAYGNDRFLYAGVNDLFLTSPDAINWGALSSGARQSFFGIAFGNATYVAIGTSNLFYATNGFHLVANTQITNELQSVAFSGDRFVAVGRNGVVFRSTDGITWAPGRSGSAVDLNWVVFGNGLFIASGDKGTILTSPDGQTWTGRFSGSSYDLFGAACDGKQFVVVGDRGLILTSSDAVNWTAQANDSFEMLKSIDYGEGVFVAAGEGGVALISWNGVVWTKVSTGTRFNLNRIAHGNGYWTAVGFAGAGQSYQFGNAVITSGDGVNWEQREPGTIEPIYGTTFIGGGFWLCGANGMLLQSGDTRELRLSLSSVSPNGTMNVSSEGGEVGSTYSIERCEDLRSIQWSSAAEFTMTNGTTRVISLPAGSSPTFFRGRKL